jgi:hypothetical protein
LNHVCGVVWVMIKDVDDLVSSKYKENYFPTEILVQFITNKKYW